MMKLAFPALPFGLLIAFLGWGSVTLLPETAFYPRLTISSGKALSLEFFMAGQAGKSDCDRMLSAMRASAAANCPSCGLESVCSRGLSDFHRRALGKRPLPDVSLRLVNGVLVVRAEDVPQALALCGAIRGKMHAGPCATPGAARR